MRVAVNGVSIFFEVIGEKLALRDSAIVEKPTLLVLHGGPGFDHSGLRGFFDRFADVAQVVYLDHRANGRSDHGPRSTWNLDQWGDDVAAFCEVLEIEHPVVFGHSFGGFVAQSYLVRHPWHPAKVILSSTSATCRFDRSLAVYERLGGAEVAAVAARTFARPSLEAFLEFSMVCTPLYHRRQEVAWPRRPEMMTLEVLLDFWRDGAPAGAGSLKTFDLRAGLLRAQCPVLVLGGEDDPACPIEDQQDIAALLPSDLVRFERFAECGHGTYHDAPDETEAIIRDFLAG